MTSSAGPAQVEQLPVFAAIQAASINRETPEAQDAIQFAINTIKASNSEQLATLDQTGFNPLHIASLAGFPDVVIALLDANAEIGALCDVKGFKATPLFLAANEGRTEVIQTLLSANADPAIVRLPDRLTPLHVAAAYAGSADVSALLAHGAQLTEAGNPDRDTPLHLAALMDKTSNAITLLAAGADPDARNKHGETPFTLANSHGKFKAAAAILISDPDLSDLAEDYLNTIQASHKDSVTALQDRIDRFRQVAIRTTVVALSVGISMSTLWLYERSQRCELVAASSVYVPAPVEEPAGMFGGYFSSAPVEIEVPADPISWEECMTGGWL